MRRFSMAFVCAVSSCFRPAPPPAVLPLQVLEIRIEPISAANDRIARLPTFVLHADRELAPPGADTVWLIAGSVSDALRSDAARGVLSTTLSTHRIDANVELDASDPSLLRVSPLAPLVPDASLVLVAGTRLMAADGAHLAGVGSMTGVIAQPFRVAPARECPPLVRLAFPLATDAPQVLHSLVLAFDRPLTTTSPTPLHLFDEIDEVPIEARFACPDPDGGDRCLFIAPRRALRANSSHRFVLDGLADDSGLAPQLVSRGFSTGSDLSAPAAAPSLPVACAPDEQSIAPFCMRADRGGFVVRGETTIPGAILGRIARTESQSAAGTVHALRLDGLSSTTIEPLFVWTLGLDGQIATTYVFDGITTPPPRAPFRITEVLAHPRSTSAQEFVEIENAGQESFDTDHLRIETPTGSTLLPRANVMPHARAIIVGSNFDPRGVPAAGDPAAAPGTIVIRLPATLAGRGLSDHGADVWLADASGQVISRAPTGEPSLAPQTGVSVVRADSRLVEDDPAGWSYDAFGGSTPGLPDRLR